MPAAAVTVFETALEPLVGASVTGGPDPAGLVPFDLYVTGTPNAERLAGLFAAGAEGAEIGVPQYRLEQLPDIDWVAESQKALPPVRAGRFFVHGSHVTAASPAGTIPLLIEANVAFGTGQHETTRGCLLALCDLAKCRRPASALDMGCGSGILAMAIAKLWACPVIAADNDTASLRVARENVALNGVSRWIDCIESDGYAAARLRRGAPYGLIAANILAEPLVSMARDLHQFLAPGGAAVLSGLLEAQERRVVARHRAQGLRFLRRYRLGDWVTLVMERSSDGIRKLRG